MLSDAPERGVSLPDADAPARRGRPHALRATCVFLASSLILLIGVLMFQNHLLYFPSPATLADMTAGGLTTWPGASEFRGLLAQPEGKARATVIVFHGNAGHAGHRQFYADTLARLGARVILAEYPGYGPRPGELGEDSLVADAAQTITLAHHQFPEPLLIIGESLGAGVAAAAVRQQIDPVTGLLLITPWDRLENVARHHYPLLPVRWLLRDQYDSASHLADLGRPVWIAVAGEDEIIPPRFGLALYAALSEPKRLSIIERAGHNDWFYRLDDSWWEQVLAFLLGDTS